VRDDKILTSSFWRSSFLERRCKGPVKKHDPNVDIETYAFLATTPNSLVSTIKHERMPVVLTREDVLTREEEFDT
jgi:hypothetical protein